MLKQKNIEREKMYMKMGKEKRKKFAGSGITIVNTFLLSMVMAIAIFAGFGKEVRAENVVPLNVEQTYEASEDGYIIVCVVAPADGVLNISGYDANADWIKLSLIDINNNVITSGSKGWSYERVTLSSFGVRKGSKYYLKVGYDSTSKLKYTVGFTPASYWEKEDNDSSTNATNISTSKKYTGNMVNYEDVDYYKVKLTSDAKVSFTFGPKVVDGNFHPWNVELINSKGESVHIYYGSTTTTYTNYLKKGTYYLKVTGSYSSIGVNYVLSYKKTNFKVSTPSISSIKAKGNHVKKYSWFSFRGYDNYVLLNKIKIKMKGVCEGYTVKVAKKSNMKGTLLSQTMAVTKKNTITLDKHFPVYKNYYVRMRGYITTPFGEKIYGKYSKVKKVSLSAADYKKCKIK